MASCSSSFLCNTGSRLVSFQRSSTAVGVGNCHTRPISTATSNLSSSASNSSGQNKCNKVHIANMGVCSSSPFGIPLLKNVHISCLRGLSFSKTVPKSGEIPNSTASSLVSQFPSTTSDQGKDTLSILTANPSDVNGHQTADSNISFATVAALLLMAASGGLMMKTKAASSGISTQRSSEPSGGSGGGGPHKHGDGFEDGSFEEKTKQEVAQGSLTKPYDVSVRAIKGFRLYMEDEYYVADGGRFAAVFDGHGGSGVSRYLRENLYKTIRYFLYDESEEDYYEKHDASASNISAVTDPFVRPRRSVPSIAHHISALRSAFRTIEREVISLEALQHEGSTAVAVMLHESENGNRTLISANIGDSRAILSRRGRAISLTRDHKPNDEKEKARIMALGETVEWDSYSGVYRVRNLSLSRAIGDSYAKPYVSSEVEIKRLPLGEDGADEFIVLASDGLWDVMESQEVVTYVHQILSAPVPLDESAMMTKKTRRRHMSRYLSNEALRRGSGDNICVVIVWLDSRRVDMS